MEKYILSVTVQNNAGVLARVSSLFGRRGYNIDSLTVSATNNPAISRITIVVHVDDETELQQIILQSANLQETQQVFALDISHSLLRELLLIKVQADVTNRTELKEICSIYKAKIIDLSPDSMVFELTGEPEKIDAFLKMLAGYKILEMCRTGITALERGGTHGHVQQQ